MRDPDTGLLVPPPEVTVYEGPCRLRVQDAMVADTEAGERLIGVVRYTLSLPMSDVRTAAVGRGHTATVTDSLLDPGLPGRRFTVSSGFVGSQITARRFPVEEVT